MTFITLLHHDINVVFDMIKFWWQMIPRFKSHDKRLTNQEMTNDNSASCFGY
jgi:hypothetical protein